MKFKQQINLAMFVLTLVMGNALFWISFHNLDLLQNYSLIYNDINAEMKQHNQFYNIREITDCSFSNNCPEFYTIYQNSKFMAVVSHLLMLGLVMGMTINWYIKRKQSAS